MGLINNLKVQVDMPVWEWARLASTASASGSCTTCNGKLTDRYIYYYINSTNFWRYDTNTDSWQQLASPVVAPVSPVAMQAGNSSLGYQAQVISATSTTFTAAGIYGNILSGNTVRIVSGTGAGQERTISSVADVAIADFGTPTAVTSSATVTTLTDTVKTWTTNQWVGYQMRITYGTGPQQIRRILYNSATVLTCSDVAYASIENNFLSPMSTALSTTAGSQSLYAIESSVFTISSPWTVTPDITSRFIILSGGIFMFHSSGGNYGVEYYDMASDIWYTKSNATIVLNQTLATDAQILHTEEFSGYYISSTATSATSTTLSDTGQAMTLNRYAGYIVRITGGTGVGQQRNIAGNTTDKFIVYKPWDITPDATSTYQILTDSDKIYLAGNAASALYNYSISADMMTAGTIIDWGVARIGSVGYAGIDTPKHAIATITRVTTTATATTTTNHNFQTGQSVVVAGATGADASLYNGTFTITVTGATTFTYTMGSTPTGSATFNALATTLMVDAAKNWTTNSLIGFIIEWTTTASPSATGQQQRITANTANTITFAAGTIPVANTSRYIIYDVKALGTDLTSGTNTNNIMPVTTATNGYGIATSGSTTTLVDSTKSWATNAWAARRVRIVAGTGQGAEVAVTSNTATTLTYGVQTFTPDTTTVYELMDTFGRASSSGSTTTLNDNTQVWTTNQWAGKRIKFTAGPPAGSEATISSNTATQLTFGAVTGTTTDTNYSILQPATRGAGMGLVWGWNTSSSTMKGVYMVSARGGANATIDRYNITTQRWDLLSVVPFFETLTTGTNYTYDSSDRMYFIKDATNRAYYYDIVNNKVYPSGIVPYAVGTAVIGNRFEAIKTTDNLIYLYYNRASGQEFFRVLVFW